MPKSNLAGGKRGEKKKKDIKYESHHMIEKIDLSGFKYKRFSRAGMKELIEGIQALPCIRSLKLCGNGITDNYSDEIRKQPLFTSFRKPVHN